MKKTTDKHDPDLRPNIKELSGLKISAIKPLIEKGRNVAKHYLLLTDEPKLQAKLEDAVFELIDAIDDCEGRGK